MSVAKAAYQTASDVFDRWRDEMLQGTPPVLYPVGNGELARIEVGPGLVLLVGGPPGGGKTAFTMQTVTDALRLTPSLRVLVCNVEMAAATLLDRQLARLSGVDLTTIRYRELGAEHAKRIERAMSTLEALAERLCFVRPPFDLSNVAASVDDFHADVIVLDYIQRIAAPGKHADKRGSVDATMNYLRQFADAGMAVIVVSAVGRSKDKRGRNTYAGDGLNLASFRESSELEFGADDAFILTSDRDDESVTLKHLKSRHGETRDLSLLFDGRHQSFRDEPGALLPEKADAGRLKSKLAALWNRTAAANEDESDEK